MGLRNRVIEFSRKPLRKKEHSVQLDEDIQ